MISDLGGLGRFRRLRIARCPLCSQAPHARAWALACARVCGMLASKVTIASRHPLNRLRRWHGHAPRQHQPWRVSNKREIEKLRADRASEHLGEQARNRVAELLLGRSAIA